MPAQFVYGRRDGRWIHVRDLDPDLERGRDCDCVCEDCGRALQAHLGATKAWHFQHDADDAFCNPQPMTLLHAFVRDSLAARRQLWLPGGTTDLVTETGAVRRTERAVIADRTFVFSDGRAEQRVGDVQPDVVLTMPNQWDLAIEVRKTHAVDAGKLERLRAAFKDAIEFDVSDLPGKGITDSELEAILRQHRRWKWLSWNDLRRAEHRFRDKVAWEARHWRADVGYYSQPKPCRPEPVAKLREAQRRLDWAKGERLRINAASASKLERAVALGALETADRFAVACAALRLEPLRLPVYFAQRVRKGMLRHPYAWQLPMFAAFGLGEGAFDSAQATTWAERALPDCALPWPEELTRNGFSRTRAAVHGYFAQLVAQGLLRSNGARRAEAEVFWPVFARKADLLSFLAEQAAA